MVIGFRSPYVSGAGSGSMVVDILRQYEAKGPLLVDFVARVLETSAAKLWPTLQELQAQEVVHISGEGPSATVKLGTVAASRAAGAGE